MKDSTGSTKQPEETAGTTLLEQRSRALFNEQVDNIDARTRSRLNRARQAALAAASGESRRPLSGSRWLLPAGSAAALALVTLSTVHLMHGGHEVASVNASLTAPVTAVADDVEILASSEELDMLQNVDFYAWLDTQSDSLNADSAASEAG